MRKKLLYLILFISILLTAGYVSAQQTHQWDDITLPEGENIWTGLHAEFLEIYKPSDFLGADDWETTAGGIYSRELRDNVSIGTNTPITDVKLTVAEMTNANAVIAIDSGSTASQYSAIDFYDRGTNKWGIGKDPSNNFYIGEPGHDRLVIKSGGNVGIGTASPAANLHINSSDSSQIRIEGGNPGSSNVAGIRFVENGRTQYWIMGKRGSTWGSPDNFIISYYDGSGWHGTNFKPNGDLIVSGSVGWTGDLQSGSVPWARVTGNVPFTRVTGDVSWERLTGTFPSCDPDYIKGIDSNGNLICGSPSGTMAGSGTAGRIAKFTAGTTIGDSIIYETSDSRIGIGGSPSGSDKFYVFGGVNATGKIKSALTGSGDSSDTVVTKSYVDSMATYDNCGWRTTNECLDGELMSGWTSTQVKCCSKTAITCPETGWTTYSKYCTPDDAGECGVVSGTNMCNQERTLIDCLIEYQTVACDNCNYDYGTCPLSTPYCYYNFCSAVST